MLEPNQPISITLAVDEWNVILTLLNDAPYRIAAPLIDKLHRQIETVDPTAFNRGRAPVVEHEAATANGVDHAPN
jgi:hypothetical protein